MMGKANVSGDFKRDVMAQITERGYPVVEVSKWLGVRPHSLYACRGCSRSHLAETTRTP